MSTKPQRSTKYRKFRRSRYDFPTQQSRDRRGKGSSGGGGVSLGKNQARKDIEGDLGRRLSNDVIERHTNYEWVFCEPKELTK